MSWCKTTSGYRGGSAWSAVKWLWRHRELEPSWLQTPHGVLRLDEWRSDQEVVHTIVDLAPEGTELMARLFQHVRPTTPPLNGSSPFRPFSCWLSVEPSDESVGTLTAHVGQIRIGRLVAADCGVVRQIMNEAAVNRLEYDAAAIGDEPLTGHIEVSVPDRP
jgi:hypothetical protein